MIGVSRWDLQKDVREEVDSLIKEGKKLSDGGGVTKEVVEQFQTRCQAVIDKIGETKAS